MADHDPAPERDPSPSPNAEHGQGRHTDPADVPVDVAPTQRRRLNVTVLLVLAGVSAYLLGRMVWPFLGGLGGALVVAVLAHPAYRRLREVLGRPTLAALIATSLLFLLVFLPLVGVSVALLHALQTNADTLADQVDGFMSPDGVGNRWLDRLAAWIGAGDVDLGQQLRGEIQSVGTFVARRTMGFLSGVGGVALQVGVALFTLFYFLRDGEEIVKATARVLPVDRHLTDALMERSAEVIHATMFGNVAVGMAQGIAGGLAFWFLGIPGAVLWGVVMAVLGMLPVVGSPVVWGPAAVILLLQGDVTRAIILALVGTFIVGTVDNILRSKVVGDRSQIHPLGVFVSVLGGVVLFGIMGLFLGPLFFVLGVSLLEVTHGVLQPDD